MKKVTMQIIANELNISKVAVHRAFTNDNQISQKLKNSVLSKASELGYIYKPNKNFNKNKFLFIAKKKYFLNEFENFYSKIYTELSNICNISHSNLILKFYENEEDDHFIENYKKEKINGIYLAGEFSNHILSILQDITIPTIVIDYYSPFYNLNYVHLDSYFDAYKLTYYAISHGHTKIGYLGQIKETSSLTDRFLGFRKALIDYNIPLYKNWIWTKKVDNLVSFNINLDKNIPSVIICHCDNTAKNLINSLKLQNINIPKDISILSFDDTDSSLKCNPTITSLGITKLEYANSAAMIMKKQLIKKTNNENLILKSFIKERNSFIKINNKS